MVRHVRPHRLANRIGKFGRVRRRQAEHRLVRAQVLPRHVHTHRRVRIQQVAGITIELANRGQGLRGRPPSRRKQRIHHPVHRRHPQRPVAAKGLHQAPQPRRILAHPIIQVALKIARHLDVHRRADRRLHFAHPVFTRMEKSRQNVILVRGQHQLADRQPHPHRQPPRKNVAKIPGGHRHPHPRRSRLTHHPQRRMKVVHHLRQHPRPVDRVDGTQRVAIPQRQIVEQRLHNPLAVVKGPLHRQIVHIRVQHRRHLQRLRTAHPPMRMQDQDPHAIPTARPIYRRAARIAAGRAQQVQLASPLAQHVLKQVTQQLQRHILEGQRRPVEQLHNVQPLHRHPRRNLWMRKHLVAAVHKQPQVRLR